MRRLTVLWIFLGLVYPTTAFAPSTKSMSGQGSRFAVTVDGTELMFAKSVEVSFQRAGANATPVAQVKTVVSMADAFKSPIAGWLNDELKGNGAPKPVTIRFADFNYKAQKVLTLSSAQIQSVTFPKWDGSSKDGNYLALTMSSPYQEAAGNGQTLRQSAPSSVKAALNANFAVTISGLPTTRIVTVELPPLPPADRGPADITFTVSEVDRAPYIQWFNDTDDPRDGQLKLLAPDMSTVVGVIKFTGLVPVELSYLQEANSQKPQRVSIKCQFDSITLVPAGTPVAAVPPSRMFGTTYIARFVGALTVESMAYDATRFAVPEQEAVVPRAGQKLVITHLKFQNAGQDPVHLDASTIMERVTDTDGTMNYSDGNLYDEKTHARVGREMRPGASAHVILVAPVGANARVKSLELRRTNDRWIGLVYDLTVPGNTVQKLAAPYLNPKDKSGVMAVSSISAKPGRVYALGSFDVTYRGMQHADNFDGSAAWVARFDVVNRAMEITRLDGGTFETHMSTDGSDDLQGSGIYGQGTDSLGVNLRPGAEETVRIPFYTRSTQAPAEISIREREDHSRPAVYKHPAGNGAPAIAPMKRSLSS